MVFKCANWIAFRKTRERRSGHLRNRRPLVLEALESRFLLSATSVTDADILFQTVDQNLWNSGPAAKISESFSETLLDVNFNPISLGGFANIFGDTGLKATFSGGFDLGFSGSFDVTGGEVDVDYQTDITVSALTSSGGTLSSLVAGDRFILRATDSPDPTAIMMETEFANIGAGLFLDYGLEANASLLGKIAGKTVVNTGFNKSVSDSVELIGAELNAGTGIGELRLLGGNPPIGKTFDISEDGLEFSDPTGILNAGVYVPALNTGDPNDEYDDSIWNGSQIVNQHLPVDRSEGRTRIDFFKLGIGTDDIVSTVTGVPLSFEIGGKKVKLDVTLINADLEAYLGVAQRMTFDPMVMVDYNFLDGNGNPLFVSVETSPGSGIYQAVTTKRVALGQDLGVIHNGGTLNIDTDYVLSGQFHNVTDIYLSPAFTLDVGAVELTGSLIKTAQDLNLLPDDLSFSLFSRTFPIANPIKIANLFDRSFSLGGFGELDGSDLSLTAGPPTVFTVLASAQGSTITEGQDLFINGTIFDPTGATDGSDTYTLSIDWKDGTSPQLVTLDTGTTAAPNGVTFDPVTRVFSATRLYADEIGSQDLFISATRITDTSQTDDVTTTVTVRNAAPSVSLEPLFLDRGGNATLTGSFNDPGVLDRHTVTIDWGSDTSQSSSYSIPAIGNLSVNQTFTDRGVTFKVTSLDVATGKVGFEVTGKSYAGEVPEAPAKVIVRDADSGVDQATVPVPWGLSLNVTPLLPGILETETAMILVEFTDDSASLLLTPLPQKHRLVVDWDNPNDLRDSIFDVEIKFIPSLLPLIPPTAEVNVTKVSNDNAILNVISVEATIEFDVTGVFWNVKPTFTIERSYADDGAGDGMPQDTSNVVVNMFELDGTRGGTDSASVIVVDVPPTLRLNPTAEVGAGGVALLSGRIEDIGKLDSFSMNVNWGDGSALETFTFDPSSSGSQNFLISHVYKQDLDGGSYQVTATVTDDDNLSQTKSTAFVVDFDKAPVAYDDFVATDADQVLLIDVLGDNDSDPDTDGDVDPEGTLDATLTAVVNGSVIPVSAAGVLTNNGEGTFSFDPRTAFASLPRGQTTTVTFDYQIEDIAGQTDTGTVTIVVTGVNTQPVAVDDANTTAENASVSTDVIANDTDVDPGDALSLVPGSATIVSMIRDSDNTSITVSTASVAENGNSITFDPGADFDFLSVGETATVLIDYSVKDSNATPLSDVGRLTVTVTGTNNRPVITGLNSSNGQLESKGTTGSPISIDGTFFDADASDTHTVMVNWGDGSAPEAIDVTQDNPTPQTGTFTGSHPYSAGGIYAITITLDDGNGGVASQTTTAVIAGVGVVDGNLYIIGTDGRDEVRVSYDGNQLKVRADFNSGQLVQEEFVDGSAVDQIIIHLCAGDDETRISRNVNHSSTVDGGAGNDHLEGGGGRDFLYGGDGDDLLRGAQGSDVLFGGEGDDRLQGGVGRDILIGGLGNDSLEGGKGEDLLIGGLGSDYLDGGKDDDLLIAGSTSYDLNTADLDQILTEWGTSDDYEIRVDRLRETVLAAGTTVFGDDSEDELIGGSDRDWFFANLADTVGDKTDDEFWDIL